MAEPNRARDSYLAKRLAGYSYDRLISELFSESGKVCGGVPLLASTPVEHKEALTQVKQAVEEFMKYKKSGSNTIDLKRLVMKTVRLLNKTNVKDDNHRQEVAGCDVSALSHYERASYVVKFAMENHSLKDEVYCMLFKIIKDTKVRVSEQKKVWVLLKMLIGAVLPTPKMVLYLARFIDDETLANDSETRRWFVGAVQNGSRLQPTSFYEFESLEQNVAHEFGVTLMDGSTHAVRADPSLTAKEVIDQVAKKIKLKDKFGFSVYITMDGKSQEVAEFAARRLHVENKIVDESRLTQQLPALVPNLWLGKSEANIKSWTKLILSFYNDCLTTSKVETLKSEFVIAEKKKRSSEFTRTYDVKNPENGAWLTLSVNSEGLTLFLEEGDIILNSIKFSDVEKLIRSEDQHNPLVLKTSMNYGIQGEIAFLLKDGKKLRILSHDSKEIENLIKTFQEGLQVRSEWALARKECHENTEANTVVSCGDLLKKKCGTEDREATSFFNDLTENAIDRLLTKNGGNCPVLEEGGEDVLESFREL